MPSGKTKITPHRRQRVLLVDDHPIVREGFTELINRQPDLAVCGEASTAALAMAAVEKLKPDVVLVDLSLHGGSGLDLIKNLKALHPVLPMLVLSMHDEAVYAERAMRAGALGYVMKREDSATVLQAIRTVLKREVYVSAAIRNQFLTRMTSKNVASNHTGVAHLSDRELEVFKLLGEGRTTRQIATQLHVSVSTVETHRTHLKEKLHLDNAAG